MCGEGSGLCLCVDEETQSLTRNKSRRVLGPPGEIKHVSDTDPTVTGTSSFSETPVLSSVSHTQCDLQAFPLRTSRSTGRRPLPVLHLSRPSLPTVLREAPQSSRTDPELTLPEHCTLPEVWEHLLLTLVPPNTLNFCSLRSFALLRTVTGWSEHG